MARYLLTAANRKLKTQLRQNRSFSRNLRKKNSSNALHIAYLYSWKRQVDQLKLLCKLLSPYFVLEEDHTHDCEHIVCTGHDSREGDEVSEEIVESLDHHPHLFHVEHVQGELEENSHSLQQNNYNSKLLNKDLSLLQILPIFATENNRDVFQVDRGSDLYAS